MIRYLAIFLFGIGAYGASYTEADFGFSTAASDNLAAFASMQATLANDDTVTFTTPGRYKHTISAAAACTLTALTNVTILAGNADFFSEAANNTKYTFILSACSNVVVKFCATGHQNADVLTNGHNGIFLKNDNIDVSISGCLTGLYYGVRSGAFYSSGNLGEDYLGNQRINSWVTNANCKYGHAYYLTDGGTITNYSVGDSDRAYAAGRAVYMAACTNLTVYSWAKDMHITDGVHLVTSSPTQTTHAGSSNIVVHATDDGTTYSPGSGKVLGRLAFQQNIYQDVSTAHSDITFDLHATSSAAGSIWTGLNLFSLGGVTAPAAQHSVYRLKVTGAWDRTADPASTKWAMYIGQYSTDAGIHYVDLDVENFSDTGASSGTFIGTYAAGSPGLVLEATGCNVTRDSGLSLATPAIQTYTYLGACGEPNPPDGAAITALGPYAYLDGLIPQSFRVAREGTDAIDVNYTISGTAELGVDYTLAASPLAIGAGESFGDLVVQPLDAGFGDQRTVIVTLAAGTGYTVEDPPLNTATIIILPKAYIPPAADLKMDFRGGAHLEGTLKQ